MQGTQTLRLAPHCAIYPSALGAEKCDVDVFFHSLIIHEKIQGFPSLKRNLVPHVELDEVEIERY